MKISAKHTILAADSPGTTWYQITKADLLDNMLWADNVWIKERIASSSLEDCIDITSLEGSAVDGDLLYLIDSDYSDIMINGEEIDPLEAIQTYGLSAIAPFISDNPTTSVIRSITDSDISWDGVDIEDFARDLLKDNSLEQVARDAEEIGLISM